MEQCLNMYSTYCYTLVIQYVLLYISHVAIAVQYVLLYISQIAIAVQYVLLYISHTVRTAIH